MKEIETITIPLPSKDAGYPFVQMLGNRLNDIEKCLNQIIRELGNTVLSPASIKMSAIAGLTALSAARDFLPVLTIKKTKETLPNET